MQSTSLEPQSAILMLTCANNRSFEARRFVLAEAFGHGGSLIPSFCIAQTIHEKGQPKHHARLNKLQAYFLCVCCTSERLAIDKHCKFFSEGRLPCSCGMWFQIGKGTMYMHVRQ